jgi:endonuclease/exonuclease/phosphatase family metal-dependent hydrolase
MPGLPIQDRPPRKIISWNLLRAIGASLDDIVDLIEQERPDLLLMQEATLQVEGLCARVGGTFSRAPMPGRSHGPAMWSPTPWAHPPMVLTLPAGSLVDRVCQILDCGDYAIANVHLSHGQLLNRRQLRRLAKVLPPHAAVLGDFNLVGPVMLPGFRDAGPRRPTFHIVDMLPVRLDRCMVRGLVCRDCGVLPRGRSDHRPIVVHLSFAGPHAPRATFRDRVRAIGSRRRAAVSGAAAK